MRALLPLVLLLAAPAAAQEPIPDTTAPWRYYPLEVGNVWEYRCIGEFCSYLEQQRVVGDTVIEGRTYTVRRSELFTLEGQPTGEVERVPLRFDPASGRVMRWFASLGADLPVTCDLGAAFGGTTDCTEHPRFPDGEPEETDVSGGYSGTVLLNGQAVEVQARKQFDVTNPADYPVELFAAPLGLISSSAFGGAISLLYARIRGVEYGTPVVGAELPAPPAAGLRLEVRPNPSTGDAFVALTLPESGPVEIAVFDVLGRRVALLHGGPLPAGAHRLALDAAALPEGLYLVRATAGRTSATVRLTLR